MSTENLSQQENAEQNYEVPLEEALELAKGHHQNGNYVIAERTYRDILRAIPKHFPTTQLLGALLYQNGYYEEAKIYFQESLDENPEDLHCLNNMSGVNLQLGDYEAAAQYLEKALEIDPKFADGLSNMTYTQWQLRNYRETEDYAQRLLALQPENVNALNSLAISLGKRFRYQEAIEAWEKAIKIEPENATCISNWGNTLRDMGRLKEAMGKCGEAYEIDPEDPLIVSNYAATLRDNGKIKEAIELFRESADLKPNHAEAHIGLAVTYNDEGQYKDAAIAARYAIAFLRTSPQAYNALSTAEYAMGNLSEAHLASQMAIRYADEEDADPYIGLAEVLVALDQYDDAEAAIAEALKRQPESARAYITLSDIRQQMHQTVEAHQAIDRGLELSPQMPQAILQKSALLYHQTKVDQAIEWAEKANEIAPAWMPAMRQKADCLVSLGRNDEAEALINKMIEINDKSFMPYNVLANFKKFDGPDDPLLQKMLTFESKVESLGVQSQSGYYLSLASVYDKFGDYDQAFEYLKKGNDAKKKFTSASRSVQHHASAVERSKKIYTRERIDTANGHGNETDLPIFVLGMPRSGTTLTEQIISSHPEVAPGGELTFFSSIRNSININDLAGFKDAGEEYLRLVRAFVGIDKNQKFTDKMPGNYMLIGLIRMVLPNAKIIYCRRNPIDNCLSCYQQHFYTGHYWSYDLEEAGDYYKQHEEMMDHWREICAGEFLEVQYEDTVGDLEKQARRIIDFIGLDWDDACLEPHKLKRAVLTASRAQVTQPVYKTSVEKWRRYEKGLQPLVRKLAPDLALPEEEMEEDAAQ